MKYMYNTCRNESVIFMKKQIINLKDGELTLKLIVKKDFEAYYTAGFLKLDPMVNYYTGTTKAFTKQDIKEYIERIVDDERRYDFLIYFKGSDMLGEIVLNEIDWDTRMAGFRIALFHQTYCEKGIGKKSIDLLLKFAFETLRLHRIELEVFDFNTRAKHVYEHCGFQVEGKKRDGLYLNNSYHDVYIMSMLESDYIGESHQEL